MCSGVCVVVCVYTHACMRARVCVRVSHNAFTGTGSLKAQRLLTAASVEVPDKVERLSRELWMRVWSRVSVCMTITIAHPLDMFTH